MVSHGGLHLHFPGEWGLGSRFDYLLTFSVTCLFVSIAHFSVGRREPGPRWTSCSPARWTVFCAFNPGLRQGAHCTGDRLGVKELDQRGCQKKSSASFHVSTPQVCLPLSGAVSSLSLVQGLLSSCLQRARAVEDNLGRVGHSSLSLLEEQQPTCPSRATQRNTCPPGFGTVGSCTFWRLLLMSSRT